MRDLHNNLISSASLNPATRTASANGSSANMQGYEAAEVIVHAGAYTDGTHALTLEESTNDSTFTDVAAADILGTEPTISASAGQNKTYRFGYIGSKQYIRVITTVTGSPQTGALYGAVILRGKKRDVPTGTST